MTNSTLFSLLASLAVSTSAYAAIPSVLEVAPAPNSTVDKISEVTISYVGSDSSMDVGVYTYTKTIQINGVPVNITGSSNQSRTAAILTLETPITAAGDYNIFIPADAIYYDSLWGSENNNPDMEWKVTVAGGGTSGDTFTPIQNDKVSITPKQGKYTSLQYFTLDFEYHMVFSNSSIKPYIIKDDGSEEVVATGKAVEGAGLVNGYADFDKPITEPGTYILVVPTGAFYEGYLDEDIPESRWRYVVAEDGENPVTNPTQVIATPSEDTVLASLSQIILEFPDYQGVYYSSTKGTATVYDKDGNAVATLKDDYVSGLEDNKIALEVVPEITANGTYTVEFPARVFTLVGEQMYDDQASTAFTLTYNVDSAVGIEAIATEEADAPVYRIDGTRVINSDNLPAGIYIRGGKKIIVK